jgi:hypothetical protein
MYIYIYIYMMYDNLACEIITVDSNLLLSTVIISHARSSHIMYLWSTEFMQYLKTVLRVN